MKLRLLAGATLLTAVTFTVYAQVPAPVTPEALVTAAKRAAGAGHPGTFLQKMTEVAEAAGATVLMSNHTEFDRAYDRARIQLPRAAGENHTRPIPPQ
jgi:hypothetical protein